MGKYDLGLSIVKSCSAWVKASGKSNILQTKPQVFTKNTVFAYKPTYARAVDSIYRRTLIVPLSTLPCCYNFDMNLKSAS